MFLLIKILNWTFSVDLNMKISAAKEEICANETGGGLLVVVENKKVTGRTKVRFYLNWQLFLKLATFLANNIFSKVQQDWWPLQGARAATTLWYSPPHCALSSLLTCSPSRPRPASTAASGFGAESDSLTSDTTNCKMHPYLDPPAWCLHIIHWFVASWGKMWRNGRGWPGIDPNIFWSLPSFLWCFSGPLPVWCLHIIY